MKDKISVITTFYNSSKYILQSIESVINQVLDNSFDIEYILVDDCSTDNTLDIVREYLSKIESNNINIKIIQTKENVGCGGARETGIRMSTGNYLMFLDSDDYYIYNGFVKRAHDIIVSQDADLVEFGYQTIDFYGRHVEIKSDKVIVSNDHTINAYLMLQKSLIAFMPWTKIIKRNIIETKSYSYARTFEDIRTTPYWVYNANIIVIYNTIEINYRRTSDSIIRDNEYSTRLGTVSAISELFDYFKNNKKILKAMYDRCLIDLRTLLKEDSDTEYFKQMSLLNTKMLSYIYPDNYQNMTYNVE